MLNHQGPAHDDDVHRLVWNRKATIIKKIHREHDPARSSSSWSSPSPSPCRRWRASRGSASAAATRATARSRWSSGTRESSSSSDCSRSFPPGRPRGWSHLAVSLPGPWLRTASTSPGCGAPWGRSTGCSGCSWSSPPAPAASWGRPGARVPVSAWTPSFHCLAISSSSSPPFRGWSKK